MINNRLFGSDIPIKVKKKLEARQLLAEKSRPNETIDSRYKDSSLGSDNHPYSDWVVSDFDFTGDLSSRVPFARMWTAVSLYEDVETGIEYDNVQVAVVMLGALAVGTIIGYGAAITNILSSKSEIRALKNKNRHLSDELNDLRNAAIDEEIYDSEDKDE